MRARTEDDLDLRNLREGGPDGRRGEALVGGVVRGRVGVRLERERPAGARLVHDVANEAGHRNAAVLDLRVAEEANARLVVGLEDVDAAGDPQRIPEADGRVLLARQRLELGHAEGRSGGDRSGSRSGLLGGLLNDGVLLHDDAARRHRRRAEAQRGRVEGGVREDESEHGVGDGRSRILA